MGRREGWQELKQRTTSILDNVPKSWFKNAFRSLPDNWKEVVQRGGKISDYYLTKRRKTI